ncbi:hypothetical protein IGI58_001162 [Enterococcus sp. AZ020]
MTILRDYASYFLFDIGDNCEKIALLLGTSKVGMDQTATFYLFDYRLLLYLFIHSQQKKLCE